MWRAILFLSFIAVAGAAPAAHADLWTMDYNGPFRVSLDSAVVTIYGVATLGAAATVPIDKELLEFAKPKKTIHCILIEGPPNEKASSNIPGRSGRFRVSHIYVNIGGEDIPVSMDGKIRFVGKNLVLSIMDYVPGVIQSRP